MLFRYHRKQTNKVQYGHNNDRHSGFSRQNILDNRGKGIGLRLGVKTTGCSGMAYSQVVDELNEEDSVFEHSGVKVIIDAKSLVYLDGTELDYVKEGLNEGFEFNNPNAKGECCVSFNV